MTSRWKPTVVETWTADFANLPDFLYVASQSWTSLNTRRLAWVENRLKESGFDIMKNISWILFLFYSGKVVKICQHQSLYRERPFPNKWLGFKFYRPALKGRCVSTPDSMSATTTFGLPSSHFQIWLLGPFWTLDPGSISLQFPLLILHLKAGRPSGLVHNHGRFTK